MSDREAALDTAERDTAAAVRTALDEVADEYTDAIRDATELVAARFSVGFIARMWSRRVPTLMRRLLGIADTAARNAADDVDAELPEGWDDLPGRHDNNRALPASIGQYVETTEQLLHAVGDQLAAAAREALAAGIDAGDDIDQLRDRLRDLFARDGAQLGEFRADRIARTEAVRAWNTATLAAAQALTGPDRPLVKQWITRSDNAVRSSHRAVNAQLRLLDEPFTVAGVPMSAPGDPTAPPSLTVNCRCRLAVAHADRTAASTHTLGPEQEAPMNTPSNGNMPVRTWSTPGDAALAFENEPGALTWTSGPWPLQYADEMLSGHDGAELAGAIQHLDRDGDRITGSGVLYLTQRAGAEAAMLLREGAPLGVSVDLDDVDIQLVESTGNTEEPHLAASLAHASLMRLDDGGWSIQATPNADWVASAGGTLARTRPVVQLLTGPGGRISAAAVRAAFAGTNALTAAAGDPDNPHGTVVQAEHSGDMLMRITRARVRGATLVAMPAYDRARIVLDPVDDDPAEQTPDEVTATAGDVHQRVITYVTASPTPVGAAPIAAAVGMSVTAVRSHLARAVKTGALVRLAPGLYTGTATLPEGPEVTAAVSGDMDLPVAADRDREWDGDAAASRVLDWATNDGTVDADRLARAFLYRAADADPATLAAYKLGMADIVDGTLTLIPRAVYAIAAALQGARGGVDLPAEDRDRIRDRVEDLYERLADHFDDPTIRAPWDTDDEEDDDEMSELEASAWTAMREADPMPAAWFREPTEEELPPGSGGVHYKDGRIYGWVAQAGEPHAGHPGKNLTIESLGKLDMSHFLRARFKLDDGTFVKAGAFTMNAPHGRDGAECETAACQFDDTRTVAGIVTVGMNKRGLWFSGAASPWMSDWDRQVFTACQPSYHMKRGSGGRWQLRAVLSVPVPGHSSPLLASAVAERANLALAASAAAALPLATETAAPATETASTPQAPAPGIDTAALVAALTDPAVLDTFADALDRRRAETRAELARLTATVATARDEITASAAGHTRRDN